MWPGSEESAADLLTELEVAATLVFPPSLYSVSAFSALGTSDSVSERSPTISWSPDRGSGLSLTFAFLKTLWNHFRFLATTSSTLLKLCPELLSLEISDDVSDVLFSISFTSVLTGEFLAGGVGGSSPRGSEVRLNQDHF